MKKIIELTLIVTLFLTCLVGCGTDTTSIENNTSNTKVETKSNVTDESKTTDTNTDVDKNDEPTYYPFVKKDGEHMVLTVTPQEFIENYNKAVVGRGEDGRTFDVSTDDFEFSKNSSYNGRQTSYYTCPLTILGRNDGIRLTMEVYDDDNTILGVQLMIKDYYVYDSEVNSDFIFKFYEQYACLMMGLGLSAEESGEILANLEYNEVNYKNYSLYKKGLAFNFSRNKEYHDIALYRIFPLTEAEAEGFGYGDVKE